MYLHDMPNPIEYACVSYITYTGGSYIRGWN